MAGTFEASTINVISPNGLVTKAITASDGGYAQLDGKTISYLYVEKNSINYFNIVEVIK